MAQYFGVTGFKDHWVLQDCQVENMVNPGFLCGSISAFAGRTANQPNFDNFFLSKQGEGGT